MSIKKVSLFIVVFIGLAVGRASADEMIMKVTVPFEFVVQGHVLPAGTYDIQAGANGPEVIWIKGEKKNRSVSIALTTPDAVPHNPSGHQPTLVFTRDEKQPRLFEILESNGEGLLIQRHSALQ